MVGPCERLIALSSMGSLGEDTAMVLDRIRESHTEGTLLA